MGEGFGVPRGRYISTPRCQHTPTNPPTTGQGGHLPGHGLEEPHDLLGGGQRHPDAEAPAAERVDDLAVKEPGRRGM